MPELLVPLSFGSLGKGAPGGLRSTQPKQINKAKEILMIPGTYSQMGIFICSGSRKYY